MATFYNLTTGSESPASGAPLAPQGRRKRSQVARACDWCRKHRIRCDNHYPCANCRNRREQCSNEVSRASSLPVAHKEIDQLRQRVQELELELGRERRMNRQLPTDSLSPPELVASSAVSEHGDSLPGKHWGGIHMNTARSPHKTWYGPSSLFYFIGRINNFLNSTLQQAHSEDHMILNSISRLIHEPNAAPDDPSGPQVDDPEEAPNLRKPNYLSSTQEEYFLDLFWQSYHTSLFPILDEAEFKQHYRSLWTASGNTRKPSALVDMVVAMCMQYGVSMLPAVKQQQVVLDNNDASIAGRWHYRRSQTLLARELESPTISTLQCHLLCCIYLCCGSFQNMADSACGLAVRAAYMLGIHLDPPATMPQRDRQMRKRLWWALYVLDSKIGMKLGRPFLLPYHSAFGPALPGDTLEVAMHSGSNFAPLGDNVTWLSFNLHHSKLFRTARAVHTAFYGRDPAIPDNQTIWDDVQALQRHAQFIEPYIKTMDDWAVGVPPTLKTKRQNNGSVFSTDGSALDIELFAPLWLQRQRLLLELMYHHLCANLYRPFISFRAVPTSGPADEASRNCALHAMAVTNIMYQVLATTTILAGWHEAFQVQWNAAIILVGYVLSQPRSSLSARVRSAIDVSVSVFDIFGDSFAVAISASKIMRDLRAKINLLAEQDQSAASYETAKSKEPVQENMRSENPMILDGIVSVPGVLTASDVWGGNLSFDELNNASMQDVFSMAFAVDEWSNLDSLWPELNPEQMSDRTVKV
ncbi:Transcription factor asqA [Paramyrothecium foliicola]|nr:Transcription factor asqA [Paramyrothecium foliicola]